MVDNCRTAAKARSAQVLRNSPRAMPLLGFTNFGESAWMFSFFSVRGCPARHQEPITVKS